MCDCRCVLDILISFPLAIFPVGRLLNHMGSTFPFQNFYAAFYNGILIFLPIYTLQTFPSLCSLVIVYLFIFLIMTIVAVIRGYLILVLICIYLIVINVGHFLYMSISHLHFFFGGMVSHSNPWYNFQSGNFFCLSSSYNVSYVFRVLIQYQIYGL